MRVSFNDFMKNANVESNVFGVERFRSRDSANVGEEERRQRGKGGRGERESIAHTMMIMLPMNRIEFNMYSRVNSNYPGFALWNLSML